MNDINSHLQQLQVKLQQLLKNYQQLQKENAQLKKSLAKKSTEVDEYNAKNGVLQQQLDALQLTKNTFDETERLLLQKRIDVYLKEIEKCMALLNSDT